MTVLFSDIRGFTTISEKLSPEKMVRLLKRYFTPMTHCVLKHGGTMDKFIGDSLMAFWNAPLDVENHQLKFVMAALDMQKKLKNADFLRELGVEIHAGIGINSGKAHIGNMGSDDLLDYTCIGDSVNMASRLERLCKTYKTDIITSGNVKRACGGKIHFRFLDYIRVKGKIKAIDIYTPVENADREFEASWDKALNTYFEGEFARAHSLFMEIERN